MRRSAPNSPVNSPIHNQLKPVTRYNMMPQATRTTNMADVSPASQIQLNSMWGMTANVPKATKIDVAPTTSDQSSQVRRNGVSLVSVPSMPVAT